MSDTHQVINSIITNKDFSPHHSMNATKSFPSRTIVHAKLEMTEPGDHDEQEADTVANTIAAGGKIRRKISGGSGSSGITVSNQMERQLNHLKGGGQAMPTGLRNMMESGFGQDFSHVRLHTDSEAASLSSSIHAKAFTHGNDIYFNQGQFSPNTAEGQKLMAHELTHTIQNSGEIVRRKKEGEEDEGEEQRSARLEKEKRIRGGLYNTLKNEGFTSRYITISKNQKDGLNSIDIILSDCESLIKQMDTLGDREKEQVVKQVYNTLTQIASTMDILIIQGKDILTTDWSKTRDLFTNVVRNLAKKAHNPAIAVLMYEGTYYNGSHDHVLDATKKAANSGKSYMLSRYGAVCNNAVWGSLIASDVTYEFVGEKPKNDKGEQSRIMGLKRPGKDRLDWSKYNLIDLIDSKNGEEGALKKARQGDVIIFWENGDPSQNADASHIEIIVDVRKSESGEMMFLLSGAHNSKTVNGISRNEGGSLYWKDAQTILKGKKAIRLLPIDRNSGFIPVDLSNMQYEQQTYTKNEKGSYPVWENSLDQVTINWLSKQDVIGQEESFEQTFPMSDFKFNISPELCLDPKFLKKLPIEDQKKIMDMSIKGCPSFQDLFLSPLDPKFFEPANNSFPSNYVPPIKNNSHKIKLPDKINKGQISDFYYLGINWKNWSLSLGHTKNIQNLKEFWLGFDFKLP